TTEAIEVVLKNFLEAFGIDASSIMFRLLSEKEVDAPDGEWRNLLRVKGQDGELVPLHAPKYTRSFFGLFWRIHGAMTMVFAMTTQASELGDLYFELVDSVSLIPHGLLRGDIYRLVQLCLVAQQQASNESKGIEDAAVKLWSSAA
ncbi:unnamed protein product, partial [Ectocarpus fasciculatus]